MATLHGKTLSAKEYKALQLKWKKEDKAFWIKNYKEEIARKRKHIALLKSGQKSALRDRIIAINEKELKNLIVKSKAKR
jgi:hypothetical protein